MFVFRKIWRALLSSYLRFEICSFHCITKKNIPSLQPLPLIFLLQHNVLICDPSHHKPDNLCAQITFVPLNSLSSPVLIVSAENVTEYFSSNETLCLIRYYLYNLQTIEKHPLKSVTFSNVAKVTLSMGVFHVF